MIKIKIPILCQYLSDFVCGIPSHVLINKGITGCGGTTAELISKRDSIILCPTRNLVNSKATENFLGVTGETSNSKIREYVSSDIKYKKIIATYDSLERIISLIPNYKKYFLLIDEYHLLFNDYSFRSKAIMFILNNFREFENWAFMTATPLKEEFILKELQDVEQITYEWENATPVKITVRDTYYIQKELLELIQIFKDRNLHIFLNSVTTIHRIIDKLDTNDFRVVCSDNSKVKIENFAKVTDPIKKLNFYTSCAFEGCDIYDPNGMCIIVSDTNISTTVLDISTKIRQVCGRLRDSKYKDEVYLILNTNKHRYAGTSKKDFLLAIEDSERRGKRKEELLSTLSEDDFITELKLYNKETYSLIYLNQYNNKIFYDENLKKLDIYNYNLISEIYSDSISVLTEIHKTTNYVPTINKSTVEKGLTWIINTLQELSKSEYTYQELETIFQPLFSQHNLKWNKRDSIRLYFPSNTTKRKMVKGKRETYYKFDL